MNFTFFTVASSLLVLALSVNCLSPIESGQLTSVFKPRTVPKVYNSCGSACPKRCNTTEPQVCILVCKEGLFCPTNYYENSVGECVLKEDCDIVQPTPYPDTWPVPRPFPTHPGPRPRPFPRPLPRPLPRPFPRPFPISFPGPFTQNLTEVSDNFGRFPEFPDFQTFEPVEINSQPKSSFEVSPISYTGAAEVNGAPPAVVRTTGSNAPFIPMSAPTPTVKPFIDFNPTVPRPVLRVSKEQSTEDEK